MVEQKGIENVFHADDFDLVAKIKTITSSRGVDVVYELVGAATFSASVAASRDGGDLVHLGNVSRPPSVDKAALAARSVQYMKPNAPEFVKDRARSEESSADLFAAVQDGVFGEIGITRYPQREAVRVHEEIAARRISGSAILIP